MKETEVLEGTAEMAAKMDDITLGTAEGSFLKDKSKGICEKRMKVQVGDESFKFEHEGNTRIEGKMCKEGHGGHGFMHGHPHGHSMCGQGPQGKMGKMMLLIKVLDKMQLQELDSDRKLLSIQLEADDLPHEALKMWHRKMHMHHGVKHGACCSKHTKMKQFFEASPLKKLDQETLKPEKLELKLFINKDFKVYSKTVDAVMKGQDVDGNTHTLNLQFNVELK